MYKRLKSTTSHKKTHAVRWIWGFSGVLIIAVALVAGLINGHEQSRRLGHIAARATSPWFHLVSVSGVKTSTADMEAALAAAKPGDTITLAPGIYSDVVIRDVKFSTPVTIVSADPQHPAIFRDLLVQGSAGLTFKELEFAPLGLKPGEPGATNGDAKNKTIFRLKVLNSQNIAFTYSNFHGAPDGTLATDISGLFLKDNDNVTLSHNEFQHFIHAVAHWNENHFTVTDNKFHNIWDDGLRGGGASNVLIARNFFTDFHLDTSDVDHPDCIQFWTKGTSAPAHDIVIEDNVYVRGRGLAVHGVFIRDDKLTMYFNHIVIRHNLIIGGGFRGLSVIGANNVEMSDNIVAGYADRGSYIWLQSVKGAVSKNNRAERFKTPLSSDIAETNNQIQDSVADGGAALLKQWRQDPSRAPIQSD